MNENEKEYLEKRNIQRRDFIRGTCAAGFGLWAFGMVGCKSGFSRTMERGGRKSAASTIKKGVFSARGGNDPYKLTVAAIGAAGGMGALVKKGSLVVIKPNIAWDRTPEQAACTNPQVVSALVHLAFQAGASQVKVFDQPCNSARKTYKRSGIADAAQKAGANVIFLEDTDFIPVKISKGLTLKEWKLCTHVLEADVFINVPIVKHHSATGMTAGMKNLMGCAGGDRGEWHVGKIAQRIVDVQTVIKPDLVVIDAFRILTANGPVGGNLNDVKQTSTVAVSTDIVAADAYAATIFGSRPEDIEYIKIAASSGMGEIDFKKIGLKEISV